MLRVLDRSLSRLPRGARTAIDWAVTIACAAAFVLVFQAEVAKPYRIPTASMEPTLHCARPVSGCRATFSDRVIANRLAYRFRSPRRGEIVVFEDAGRRGGVLPARWDVGQARHRPPRRDGDDEGRRRERRRPSSR